MNYELGFSCTVQMLCLIMCNQIPDGDGQDRILCTLREFRDNGTCHNCKNYSNWRCDDGWCIEKSKVKDGYPDCPFDSSDEPYGKCIII